MVTRDDLARILRDVNVEEVAGLAGVSTKTIYRLRHKQHAPTLDTVEAILRAVRSLSRKEKRAA